MPLFRWLALISLIKRPTGRRKRPFLRPGDVCFTVCDECGGRWRRGKSRFEVCPDAKTSCGASAGFGHGPELTTSSSHRTTTKHHRQRPARVVTVTSVDASQSAHRSVLISYPATARHDQEEEEVPKPRTETRAAMVFLLRARL